MPGLVKDPVQNPTESRFGFFMDMEDGHLKIYLKLDEDVCNDVNNQSRYFTFQTPVEQCVLKASLSIDKDDLDNNECLKEFGDDRENIIDELKNSSNIPVKVYIVKFNDQMGELSDQPLTEKLNKNTKNELGNNKSNPSNAPNPGGKYNEYDQTEKNAIR